MEVGRGRFAGEAGGQGPPSPGSFSSFSSSCILILFLISLFILLLRIILGQALGPGAVSPPSVLLSSISAALLLSELPVIAVHSLY